MESSKTKKPHPPKSKRGQAGVKSRPSASTSARASKIAKVKGKASGKGTAKPLSTSATDVRGSSLAVARPVRFKTNFANTVMDVMCARGWQRVKGEADELNWDISWADVGWIKEYMKVLPLRDHMRVNHFPRHFELTRKDLLVKNLKRHAAKVERASGKDAAKDCLSFCPSTYKLPQEYRMFVEAFKQDPSSIWISKPVGAAQGKGIFMLTKLSQLADLKKDTRFSEADTPRKPVGTVEPTAGGASANPKTAEVPKGAKPPPKGKGSKKDKDKDSGTTHEYIVQQYVKSPYLIMGKKFDMRIYVLVTSFAPLECWLYREGFARFSGSVFSMDKASLSDQFIHLTNVAIQKTKKGYDKTKGCKWLCTQLKRFLVGRHGAEAVDRMNQAIDNVVLQSLQAVTPAMVQDKHCFEVYGYDILLDSDLNPWLIEVNASPSVTADTPVDYDLKCGMLDDVMNIVDMERQRGGQEISIGGFDKIWDDGPVYRPSLPGMPPSKRLNSYLGSDVEHRLQALRHAKQGQAQSVS